MYMYIYIFTCRKECTDLEELHLLKKYYVNKVNIIQYDDNFTLHTFSIKIQRKNIELYVHVYN